LANFSIELADNAVILGMNNVGKSNLLYALRLVLDPALPNSTRDLEASDFWDGLEQPFAGNKIEISLDLTDFDDDKAIQSVLTDALIELTPRLRARITYAYSPLLAAFAYGFSQGTDVPPSQA
jgi:putative ATP-dependent endonuclease of OLD family